MWVYLLVCLWAVSDKVCPEAQTVKVVTVWTYSAAAQRWGSSSLWGKPQRWLPNLTSESSLDSSFPWCWMDDWAERGHDTLWMNISHSFGWRGGGQMLAISPLISIFIIFCNSQLCVHMTLLFMEKFSNTCYFANFMSANITQLLLICMAVPSLWCFMMHIKKYSSIIL